jgi:hypothetical protein
MIYNIFLQFPFYDIQVTRPPEGAGSVRGDIDQKTVSNPFYLLIYAVKYKFI